MSEDLPVADLSAISTYVQAVQRGARGRRAVLHAVLFGAIIYALI